MKYFIKSKRKHGNPEDFRWHRGYPDEPVMGIVDDHGSKENAFNDFAESFHIINDVWLPILDFDIHVIDSHHNNKTLPMQEEVCCHKINPLKNLRN